MAQVVRHGAGQADGVGRRLEYPLAPVLPVVQLPRPIAVAWEEERFVVGHTGREAPLREVLPQQSKQADGPRRPTRLLTLELAVGDGLFDQQRPLADAAPAQGQRLLGRRPAYAIRDTRPAS